MLLCEQKLNYTIYLGTCIHLLWLVYKGFYAFQLILFKILLNITHLSIVKNKQNLKSKLIRDKNIGLGFMDLPQPLPHS